MKFVFGVGDGGSISVFTRAGVLVLVLIGSYFIDKLTKLFFTVSLQR